MARSARDRSRGQRVRVISGFWIFSLQRRSVVLAAADAHIIYRETRAGGVVVPSKMYGILARETDRRGRAGETMW